MWCLHEADKKLPPLVFSNGKSQEDIVREVLESVKEGYKIIFIRGMCGTGKSAIALNLARKLGKTSIVVPIKSLQEQYIQDYSGKKYVLVENKKLKLSSIVGRGNFKCRFINSVSQKHSEKNAKLSDIFEKTVSESKDESCDNDSLPCKIELIEKNLPKIRDYINRNPSVKLADFSSLEDVKRMTIAPVCPYWSPILPEEVESKRLNSKKSFYTGLNNRKFAIHTREKGCPYYEQYLSYLDSDVLLFNSLKYRIESLMDRKPSTELEIIDECDEFLDSFVNQEKINLNKLLFSLNTFFPTSTNSREIIDGLIDITNKIRRDYLPSNEVLRIDGTSVKELIEKVISERSFIDEIEDDESNYLYHLETVARLFSDFLEETFFSIEKTERDIVLHLVTINLAKRLKELTDKNKVIVMMSGTIHSEEVLKDIFGLEKFKVIEAETHHQGRLIPCKNGYEINCKYSNMQPNTGNRDKYLLALSKSLSCAKPPVLVHITSFSDLPTDSERERLNLSNLPSQKELVEEQRSDPLGKRVQEFKNKCLDVLFTTKCTRGIDFPGDLCNSIVITRFPYPNISSLFWKVLRQNNPDKFREFYMDKANRELLQRIYRGLRSKQDKVYLLSPDIRVLEFFHSSFGESV